MEPFGFSSLEEGLNFSIGSVDRLESPSRNKKGKRNAESKVTDPREVIAFLREKENKSAFGVGREITHRFFNKSRHGCCVQLRQFFRSIGNGFTLHYEIEEYDGGLGVEIHSETKTPRNVHDFIRT